MEENRKCIWIEVLLNLGIQGNFKYYWIWEYKERDVYNKYFKIKYVYLLPASRGSNVMAFTPN